VPEHFCEHMWRYYEGLMASVMVGDAQTAWFRFGIGVFQGCTILTVLFNACFSTSFEHLTPLEEECGYQFRDQSRRMLRVLVTGYADDIGLLVVVVVEMHSGTMIWSLKGFKLGWSGPSQ